MNKQIKLLTIILFIGIIVNAQAQITVADWGTPVIIIRTADDLRELSRRVASENDEEHRNGFAGAIFVLANDINFTAAQSSQWIPIGNFTRHFSGTFDGGNKAVRGIVIDNSSTVQRGLFGFLGEGGVIRNLGVAADIAEGNALSGLVGTNFGGKIENSFVERVAVERVAPQVQQRQAEVVAHRGTQESESVLGIFVRDLQIAVNDLSQRNAKLERDIEIIKNRLQRPTFVFSVRPEFVRHSSMKGSSITYEFGRITNNNLYITFEFGGTPFAAIDGRGGGGGIGLNVGWASDLEKPITVVLGGGPNWYIMGYERRVVRNNTNSNHWNYNSWDLNFGWARVFGKLLLGRTSNFDITNAIMFGMREEQVWEWNQWSWGGEGRYDLYWDYRFSATYHLSVGYTLTRSRSLK